MSGDADGGTAFMQIASVEWDAYRGRRGCISGNWTGIGGWMADSDYEWFPNAML